MSIDAMKQALKVLEYPLITSHEAFDVDMAELLAHRAIESLRQAIAEAEKQEPVAMRYDFDGYGYKYIDSGSGSDWKTRIKDAEPLYTTPQPQE